MIVVLSGVLLLTSVSLKDTSAGFSLLLLLLLSFNTAGGGATNPEGGRTRIS